MTRAGCAESIVEVPLFAELGGYGPFLGRRCLGTLDPLYCRVLTVNDGVRRNVVVVTDTILMDGKLCRVLRAELASDFAIYPESILFVATHTHSGACLASCDVGYGEASPEFIENWRAAVRKCLAAAIASEEEVRAFAGKASIRKPIGQRRTTDEDKHTDPEIRFVKFVRKDGSVKVLLHNHAMHGVVFGRHRYASADWMGDANRKIREAKLAEMPLYLYGTAGDINVIWTHPKQEERHLNLDWIGTSYVEDLKAGLDHCEEITLGPNAAILKAVEFPTEPVRAQECRDVAGKLLAKYPDSKLVPILTQYAHDRLLEMAAMADAGCDFRVIRDLQVLRCGDVEIAAIPGEPFLAVGEELRAASKAKFPLAVSVANGDAGYFPVREMFRQYPDIFSCDDFGAFGFYEVWFGFGQHRAKFQPQIAEFLVSTLREMAEELK